MELWSKIPCTVTLVLIFCFITMQQFHDCGTGYGCSYANAALINRKVVEGVTVYGGVKGAGGLMVDSRERMGDWELRTVPSGPDPLHHNGNTPKKPRTP